MKMKLIAFLQKVSQESYKPAKILFGDVVFVPNSENGESETVVQYTSIYPVSDNINEDTSYQTLMMWLLFKYWKDSGFEDLLDLEKLEVTILED